MRNTYFIYAAFISVGLIVGATLVLHPDILDQHKSASPQQNNQRVYIQGTGWVASDLYERLSRVPTANGTYVLDGGKDFRKLTTLAFRKVPETLPDKADEVVVQKVFVSDASLNRVCRHKALQSGILLRTARAVTRLRLEKLPTLFPPVLYATQTLNRNGSKTWDSQGKDQPALLNPQLKMAANLTLVRFSETTETGTYVLFVQQDPGQWERLAIRLGDEACA